jgi:OOP family OmpA-OmpF porin
MKPRTLAALAAGAGALLLAAAPAAAQTQPAPAAPAAAQTQPAPAAPAQSAEAPAAQPIAQKVSVKGTARFGMGSTDLNTEDGVKLMTEVRSMKNVSWQQILVIGHTDNIGSDSFNQKLSERRADVVRDFLVDKNVKPERIRTEGRGEATPVASNKTSAGRAQSRRVEIEFVGLQSLAAN